MKVFVRLTHFKSIECFGQQRRPDMSFRSIALPLMMLVGLSIVNPPPAADKYEIDAAHAFVTFTIPHLVINKAKGSFKDISGTILYDEKDPSKSSVEVAIKTASINTNNENRDKHLRSADFFDAEKYPEMSFKSKRIEGKGNGYIATGDLTIRGVTKEVQMLFSVGGPIKDPLPLGLKRIAVQASLQIDRREFGITWSRALEGGGLFVGNEVTIDINVEAIIPKPAAG